MSVPDFSINPSPSAVGSQEPLSSTPMDAPVTNQSEASTSRGSQYRLKGSMSHGPDGPGEGRTTQIRSERRSFGGPNVKHSPSSMGDSASPVFYEALHTRKRDHTGNPVARRWLTPSSGLIKEPTSADLDALRADLQQDLKSSFRPATSYVTSYIRYSTSPPTDSSNSTSKGPSTPFASNVYEPLESLYPGQSSVVVPEASNGRSRLDSCAIDSTDSSLSIPSKEITQGRSQAVIEDSIASIELPSPEALLRLAASLPKLTPLELANRFDKIFPDWLPPHIL